MFHLYNSQTLDKENLMHLYKSTIVIYSDFDPQAHATEIDALARDAIDGGSICDTQVTEEVTDIGAIPMGVAEFFQITEG